MDALEGAGVAAKSFQQALGVYKADRGWQSDVELKNQTSLTTFYFEWDRMESGLLMHLASHSPEVCNVASGLTFLGRRPSRTHSFQNGQVLSFDSTAFKTPQGLLVHVFKATWLQGEGDIDLLREYSRIERLRGSFGRHVGQARVLEGGIFGSNDIDEAWVAFQSKVLSQVEWTYSTVVE